MLNLNPYRLVKLVVGLLIVGLVLVTTCVRVKTGKPLATIIKGPAWLSRNGEIAIAIVILVLFAIFFIINSGFLR